MLAGLLLAVALRAAHELVGAGLLPALVRELGGEAWAGAFFAVYGLAAAAGILAGGRATDRWGPAGPLGFGLLTFATGMTATGLSGSMSGVVLARALEGFGGGIISVVVSAVVMRAYDAGAQPRVLAWLSAAWVVPGLVAPALAVSVADTFGWRAVFLGLAPLVVLAAALVLPSMRRAGRTAGPRAAAAASAPRAATPLLASPGLGVALAVRALLVFAFFGVEAFLPLALCLARGAGAAQVAALLTLSALAWTAGAFLHARACVRWPAPALARAGALALVAGIGCAVGSLLGGTPIGVAFAGWTLAGLGMGLAYNTATASVMSATPSGAEGAAGAALGIVDAVASSLATALGGALVAAAPLARGSAPSFVVIAFVVAAGVGLASLAPARRLCSAHAAAPPARAIHSLESCALPSAERLLP